MVFPLGVFGSLAIAMSALSVRLSGDIVLFVQGSGAHFHVFVGLVVPESSVAFVLYSFVFDESFRVRMRRWDLEGLKLEAEESAFFRDVDRLRGR